MTRYFSLFSASVVAALGITLFTPVVQASASAGPPTVSPQWVPAGAWRGHAYFATQSACTARGNQGATDGHWSYWSCHYDGFGGPLEWHLVVSQACPICRAAVSPGD